MQLKFSKKFNLKKNALIFAFQKIAENFQNTQTLAKRKQADFKTGTN